MVYSLHLKTAFVAFVFLLTVSCDSLVHFNIKNEPVLVLNAVLIAGEDSTRVQFSLTQAGDSEAEWAVIEGAKIKLYENGEEVTEAIEKSGNYHFVYLIQPEHTYKVTAEHPSYGYAWGETTVPASFLEVSIDTAAVTTESTKVFIVNRWLDNPEEQNFYWFGYRHPFYRRTISEDGREDNDVPAYDSLRLSVNIYTTSTLVDMFNYSFDHSAFIKTSYYLIARIEDSGHAGQELEFSYVRAGRICVPYILNMDKNYDAYIKSIISDYYNNIEDDDLPLFYKPSYNHSNIHGGVGIIGSYVRFQRYFNFPDEYIPKSRS